MSNAERVEYCTTLVGNGIPFWQAEFSPNAVAALLYQDSRPVEVQVVKPSLSAKTENITAVLRLWISTLNDSSEVRIPINCVASPSDLRQSPNSE